MRPLNLPNGRPAESPAEAACPQMEPLLLSARDLAQLLRVSVATVWRLRATGKLPKPLDALGSQLLRWSAAEVRAWCEAGMPNLKIWEALKRR